MAECPICFEVFNRAARVPLQLDCGHSFCKTCLQQADLKDCPICRLPLARSAAVLKPNFQLMQLAMDSVSAMVPQQIFVKALDGKSRVLEIKLSDTVLTLKRLIKSIYGIRCREQRLTFGGKQLAKDDSTLSAYGVHKSACIHLMLRLNGGSGR